MSGKASGPVGAKKTIDLTVVGVGGVPASSVGEVVVNVTATTTTKAGAVTIYPTGDTRPVPPSLNVAKGSSAANEAIVRVGTGGKLSLYSTAAAHLQVDVSGYYPADSSYTPLTPTRVLDTKTGIGAPKKAVAAGGVVGVTMLGAGGVPTTGVRAVVLNVTDSASKAAGAITVYPAGTAKPGTTDISYTKKATTTGLVIAKPGTDGVVNFSPTAASQLSADVVGYFPTDNADYTPLTPTRVLDTNTGVGSAQGPVAAGGTVTLDLAGANGIPATGSTQPPVAVQIAVTAVNPAGPGYLAAYPAGTARTAATTLTYALGETRTNAATVKIPAADAAAGKISIFTSTDTDIRVDVIGYYTTTGPAALQVQVTHQPTGSTPQIHVTDPAGATRTITQTTTYDNAQTGIWTITGDPLTVNDGKLWPIAPALQVVVTAGQTATAVMDYTALVPGTSTPIDASKIADTTTDPSTGAITAVTLSPDTPPAAVPAVGDTIAVGIGPDTPYGLLAKVTTTSAGSSGSGTQIGLNTTNATLTDAVTTGSLDINLPLGADDVVDPGKEAEPIQVAPQSGLVSRSTRTAASAATTPPEPLSKRLAKALTCQAGASAQIEGEFAISEPTIDLTADWGLIEGVKSARFTTSLSQTSSAGITLPGKASCTLARTALLSKPITFKSITLKVGPVPVVVVPHLQFFADGTVTARGALSAKYTQKLTAEAGIAYTKASGYSTIDRTTVNVSYPEPTFKGGVDAEAGVAPEINALLYNAAGPRLYIRGAPTAHAQSVATPNTATLDYQLGAHVTIGAALDIDSLKLHSGEYKPFDHTYPLKSGRLTYTPPAGTAQITTTSLPNATTGTPYTARLMTTDNRAGNWTIATGTLPAGLRLNGDTITGTPTADQDTATFTIGFDDGTTPVYQSITLITSSSSTNSGTINGQRIRQVEAGGSHTCAVTTTGAAYCWGNNSSGQLGNGTTGTSSATPVPVTGLSSGVVSISAGGNSTCAINTAGAAYCWGNNSSGQLGNGTTGTSSATPGPVRGLEAGVASISASSNNACAVTTYHSAYCWGDNFSRQLGYNFSGNSSANPVQAPSLGSPVASIFSGIFLTCALTTSGAVYCWGSTSLSGRDDIPDNQRSSNPVLVTNLGSGVDSVSAGQAHTCAVTTAGAAYCWGQNFNNQLGAGSDYTGRRIPYAVSGLGSGVASLAAGTFHACAVTTAGAAFCWGNNLDGQLGNAESGRSDNGAAKSSAVPVPIADAQR